MPSISRPLIESSCFLIAKICFVHVVNVSRQNSVRSAEAEATRTKVSTCGHRYNWKAANLNLIDTIVLLYDRSWNIIIWIELMRLTLFKLNQACAVLPSVLSSVKAGLYRIWCGVNRLGDSGMNTLGDTSAFVNPAGQLLLSRRGKIRMDGVSIVFKFYIAPL